MEPATEHPGPPPASNRRSVVRTALLALVLVGLVVGGLRSWWLSLNGCFAPTPYSPTLESGVVPQPEDVRMAIRGMIAE